MRKKTAVLAAVLLFMGIFTANSAACSDEAIVENLICRRTDALSLYYAGEVNKEKTMETIKAVTTDFLRDEDLENIEKYFQCDLEQLVDYEIEDIDITYSDGDVICAFVTITWKSEGLKGREDFSHTYSVICEKEENLHKIAQFF